MAVPVSYPSLQGITPYREFTPAGKRAHAEWGLQKGKFTRSFAVPWGTYAGLPLPAGTTYPGWPQAIADFLGYTTAASKLGGAGGTNRANTAPVPLGGGRFSAFGNRGDQAQPQLQTCNYYRNLPLAHPTFAGVLYAESIAFESDVPGDSTQNRDRQMDYTDLDDDASYEEAVFTVTFGTRDYIIATDTDVTVVRGGDGAAPDECRLNRYLSPSYEAKAKYTTLKPATLRWVPDEQEMTQGAIVFLAEGVLELTHYQLPIQANVGGAFMDMIEGPRGTTARAMVGYCNHDTFGSDLLPGLVEQFPPQTLVLLAPKETKPYQQPDGTWAVDRTFQMAHFPNGCNSFFREVAPAALGLSLPGWFPVSADGTANGKLIFPPTDFTALFDPAFP